jgi:hypothetical protein
MRSKLLSLFGVVLAFACLGVATTLHPGGFDWNRDYISTMLRGPAGSTRNLADAGVILYCVSVALVYARLARTAEFSKNGSIISIAGIGSMVYSCLTMTPLHDLMVTISLAFSFVAVLALLHSLYALGETVPLLAGCICLAMFIGSATIYYTGQFTVALPWAQRIIQGLFTVWLLSLDFGFPRRVALVSATEANR